MSDERTLELTHPIDTVLPLDAESGDRSQRTYHAVVHLVVPDCDRYGNVIDTTAAASDYIAETLRDRFLDWGYVSSASCGDLGGPVEIQA